MMAQVLRQSTAVDVLIGPFLDSTNAYDAETGVSPSVKLSKNGQTLAAKNDVTTPVHDADGYYNCELDATDTNTIGTLVLTVVGSATSLPVRHEYQVVEEAIYDAFYASGAGALATAAAQTTAQNDLDLLTGTDGVTLATSQPNYAPATAAAMTTAQNDLDIITGADGAILAATQSNAITFSSGVTISNASGSALTLSSSGSNGSGLLASGNGTGAGIRGTGGATGHGISGIGGATSGSGIRGAGTAGNSAGITGAGQGSAAGVQGTGGATGAGIQGTGGATSGPGIAGTGTAGNSQGILGSGQGSAAGIRGTGGATGAGISGVGGATSGSGIQGTGTAGNAPGIYGIGQGSGSGVVGLGGATGHGLYGIGGGTSGNGLRGIAQGGNSIGVYGIGQGSGSGVAGLGGATGHGILGSGGTNGDGIKGALGGTGVDIRGNITGDITGNLSGSAGSVSGAVGSVTGNVGGSVASVTGAVGSVTAGVVLADSASHGGSSFVLTGDHIVMTSTTAHAMELTTSAANKYGLAAQGNHATTGLGIYAYGELSGLVGANASASTGHGASFTSNGSGAGLDLFSSTGAALQTGTTSGSELDASLAAAIESEANDALVALGLDHMVGASVTGTDITDNSIVAKLVSASATADWDDYVNTTDSLQAIRDRGDAAWTTGAGGTPPQLLQNTTIATLASQTSFTLTAGSADDDAYNGAVVVVTDSATSTQKAVGSVLDYTGSTKTVTLSADPGIFTMAAGDTIDIIANASTAPTAAQVRAEIDANSTQLAAILADTAEIGAAGAGLTAVPWNSAWDAEVESEVNDGLVALGLDHLVAASVTGTDITDNSIVAKIVSSNATADWDSYVNTTESLQALRDRGDSAWATATGFSTHTAANVRTEMDANSTQLAAIVADTNELQADWADGGRLDLILDARASATALATAQTDLDTITGTDGVTLATAQALYAPAKATDIVTGGAITTSSGAVSNVTLVATTTTNTDMLTAASVNAQVVDALATDTYAEPGAVPAATATLADKIGFVTALARNKMTQTATTQTLRNDADSGNIATSTVGDDGTTATRGEWS